METLKGSDKFRQLLKKFNQPNPSTNVGSTHDTSIIRKSNRAIKKPVKYDASPFLPKAKESKSKDGSIGQKNKTERIDISLERRGRSGERSNKSRKRTTGEDSDVPVVGSTRGKLQDLRKISGEHRGRSGEGNNKSRERTTGVDSDAPVAGSSRGRQQDLREEIVCREPSSPQRSAFRVLDNKNNCLPSTSRQVFREPASHLMSRRNPDHEGSYVPDHRRQRDLESSYMPERRRLQDYEQSYVAEKRMVDNMYSEGAGVFAKPHPVRSNQSHWRPNASRSQNYDIYGTIRQPVVGLEDIARSQEHSVLYRPRCEIPLRQPYVRLVDAMKTKERETWQHSRMVQPPPDPPKRFEGGFLRPPTPPGIAELVQKEESTFIDTLSKFKNFPLCTTFELIFILNYLENTLIHKMSKTKKKSDSAQSAMRMTMMESIPEESVKSYMVQSWLKSNESVAPQRWVDEAESRKRRLETTRNMAAKKMRMAADEDLMSCQQTRQPHHTMSRSMLKSMEHQRKMNSSTPINHDMD
uniref:Uncharacterized protein n=4 Tax=Lygus hesperus TaxID=30085 RepID=A0A0K8TE74_LYGHE